MLRLLVGTIRRDYLNFASYRLSLVWQLMHIAFFVAVFYYVGNAVSGTAVEALSSYGSSYFDFLLVGVAVAEFVHTGLNSFPNAIREGQNTGTLEMLLVSPRHPLQILVSSTGWTYVFGFFKMLLYFLVGSVFFSLWGQANYVGVVLVVGLSIVCLAAVGIISASSTLVFKRGDPILPMYALASIVFGGLLFPVNLLPGWLQGISLVIPLTHTLEGSRLALHGAGIAEIGRNLVMLLILTMVLLPAGLLTFHWSVRRAREEGSLVQY